MGQQDSQGYSHLVTVHELCTVGSGLEGEGVAELDLSVIGMQASGLPALGVEVLALVVGEGLDLGVEGLALGVEVPGTA